MNTWNPVLYHFVGLKKEFIDTYGEDALWNYGEYKNCVHYWSSKLPEYEDVFSCLIINEYDDFVLFRYNLMDTDAQFWKAYNGLYKECRSVVLDKKNDCLVLTPYRKFFNLNETEETLESVIRNRMKHASVIEFSDKLDGSMQSARYYNNRIILAGTSALDVNVSFRVRIGYSLISENYERMLKDHPDLTFIFELICKEDAHIVVYSEEQRGLYLTGVRNTNTGEQWMYKDVIDIAEKYNVLHTTVINTNFDDIIETLDQKKSNEAEGFVINIDGYKVKLKYNDYVKLHKAIAKMLSTNLIIRCIEDGTWDDVRSKIPESYRPDADTVANTVKAYVRMMNNTVQKLYHESLESVDLNFTPEVNRKIFAIYVLEHYKKHAFYLIELYKGQTNNFLCNNNKRYKKYYEIQYELNHQE